MNNRSTLFPLSRASISFLLIILAIHLGHAQSSPPSWSEWETVYSEGDGPNKVELKISFKESFCRGGDLVGYSFYRFDNQFKREMAYVDGAFDYADCDGKVNTELFTVDLSKTGIDQSRGLWFSASNHRNVRTLKYTGYGAAAHPVAKPVAAAGYALDKPMDCAMLVKYMDTQLAQDFKTSFAKYTFNNAAKADMALMQQQLLSDTWWARSHGPLVAAVIEHLCKTVEDVTAIVPATGMVSDAVTEARITVLEQLRPYLGAAKLGRDTWKKGTQETAYKELLKRAGPVGRSLKALWSFGQGIQKIGATANDTQVLRTEVARAVKDLNQSIAVYNQAMSSNQTRLTAINDLKSIIEMYVRKNCKNQQKM